MASKSLGTLTLDLVLKMGAFEQGADKAGRKMQGLEKRAHAVGNALGGAIKLGAGIAAAGFGLYVKNTIEAEKVQAQLASRIKDTGGAAGRTVEQLGKMADKLQGLTIFDDEAIGGAQALLLTFTQIQGVNFDRATEAVTDLATVMGTDLDSAAKIVGKSLADPVAGLTALKKAGVIFNDEQKKLVKNLVQTGDTAGAQGVILDALKGKMGSAAEAARNTLGGALQGLQNDFNNLLEGDSGSAGVKGTTQAINDFAATLRSPEVKSGIDSLARGLATLLNLYVKGAAAALTFAQNANAVSGISAETKGQSKSQLQLRKSSLTGQLGRVSEGQDMAVRTAAWQRGTDDVAKLKQLIKADIAEIDAELNRSDYLSNSKDAAFGGAPRRMKFGKPLAASTAPAATGGGGGGSGGGRSSSRSPDNSAALEAARAQEEALEKQKSAAEDFRSTLEELRAEMGGPLAQVTLEYSRKQEELAKLIADGAISTKDAAEAYKILESQRLKEVEAINAQKSPMEELLADMEFENSLMKMNNEERLFAIQTRGMEAESIAKYGDSLKQLNEDAKQTQESIEMMDGFRDATRGLFSDLMDGSKSASDAFKDFVANILDGIAQIVAKQLTAQLMGDNGSSSGGGWLSSIFSMFGGGGGGGGGGVAAAAGSLFGGGMATGGNAKAGMFYQVNEKGPEMLSVAGKDFLMMGKNSGKITPNHSISGGGNSGRPITIINNVSPTTERRSASQIAQLTSEKIRSATSRNM